MVGIELRITLLINFHTNDIIVLKEANNGKINDKKKKIRLFKEDLFKIEIWIKMKIVNIFDAIFNLENEEFRFNRKPNNVLVYINPSSNYSHFVFKQVPIAAQTVNSSNNINFVQQK